jgi:hypothetical protein
MGRFLIIISAFVYALTYIDTYIRQLQWCSTHGDYGKIMGCRQEAMRGWWNISIIMCVFNNNGNNHTIDGHAVWLKNLGIIDRHCWFC